MVDTASGMELRTLNALKKRNAGDNYLGIANPRRYFIGYLGEQAFKAVIEKTARRFDYDPHCDGQSGGHDFTLYGWRTIKAEIKTGTHNAPEFLFVSQKAYEWRKFDVYIAMQTLSKTEVKVWGWCLPTQFPKEPKIFSPKMPPTFYVPYRELRPIETLISKLN